MDLYREAVISDNIEFFNSTLKDLAPRHFFTDAVRCAEINPPLAIAGVTCLLCGIEGSLRFSVQEKLDKFEHPETADLDEGNNLNNILLRKSLGLGFDIESLSFPTERGRMKEIVSTNKPPSGIVLWRNEFAHGRAYRSAEEIGGTVFSDSIMMAPAFRELLDLSYNFSMELAKFRGTVEFPKRPVNPLSL